MTIEFEYGDTIDLSYQPTVEQMHNLFINRDDAYAIQHKNGYTKIDENLNSLIILEHLHGDKTIGTYQLDNCGTVKWICFDIDAHISHKQLDATKGMFKLCYRLDSYNIPYILELSGTQCSYHIWVFLEQCDVSVAHKFGREWAVGIDCEVYPKQKYFRLDKPYGNLVKIPCGINKKNGKRSEIVYISNSLRLVQLYDPEPNVPYTASTAIFNDAGDQTQSLNTINSDSSVLSSDIRPCMLAAMNGEIQMTGSGGHVLRCALVPELKECLGMSVNQIVEVFSKQSDFDSDKTREQVNSLINYNRYSCNTLRTEAYRLLRKYCINCIINEAI